VKFKFLQNISHYYNNIFAFHMFMFTIYVLSFNKFNSTIHSNIRLMVITYNQNLHFKIHYKKFQTQDYNSFHHNLTLEEIHTKDEHKIHYRSLCFSITKNMNPIYSIIPCFVFKNPKTTLRVYVISKQNVVFYFKYLQLFLFSFSKKTSHSPMFHLIFILQNSPL
jgi:hypothetical protein